MKRIINLPESIKNQKIVFVNFNSDEITNELNNALQAPRDTEPIMIDNKICLKVVNTRGRVGSN